MRVDNLSQLSTAVCRAYLFATVVQLAWPFVGCEFAGVLDTGLSLY